MKLGNSLKNCRLRAGLTQEVAAERIGVGQSTIVAWEKGKSFPRAGLFKKIAEVYDCEVAEFFAEESA